VPSVMGTQPRFWSVLQRKEINILKRVSFNRHVVQFYGFCLEESAPMLVSRSATVCALGLWTSTG
jgi:hypothetical protein